MTSTLERPILIGRVVVPRVRVETFGGLDVLGRSIRQEGLRRPLLLWRDGTILDGQRRHRACLMLRGSDHTVPAIFVDTVEDVAENLMPTGMDSDQAIPMARIEQCRLIETLRRLDAPAATLRADEARRRGVELRRLTQEGKRPPGRDALPKDHVLDTVAPGLGMSPSTAKRLWSIYNLGYVNSDVTADRRAQARQELHDIDAGASTIGASYTRLTAGRRAVPVSTNLPTVAPVAPQDAARQTAVWARALPQMEGLAAGLVELGPPHPDLTWEQVGPVVARLSAVRLHLEKMIKKMRETSNS